MPGVDCLQDSNHPPTHVPTTFKWTDDWGSHFCIAGSFDPPDPVWTPIEMNNKEITLNLLPDKKYYYKFVIDGQWVTDRKIPSCQDSGGNWNHEIQVELPLPPPLPKEEKEEEIKIIEEQLKEEVINEEQKELHQENIIVEEKYEKVIVEEVVSEEVVSEESHEETHQGEVVIEEKCEEVVPEEKCEEVVPEEKCEEVVPEEKYEEVVPEEKHEETVPEEKYEETVPEEKYKETVSEEKHEETVPEEKHEEVVFEEKHEKEVLTEEKNEKEVLTEEKNEEEVVAEEKGDEEVSIEEKHEAAIEEKHEAAIEEKHEAAIEEKHEVVIEEHQEKVVTEEHQVEYQEETITEDHKVVTKDHHVDESEQIHQEEQVIPEEFKEQSQHQEGQIDNKIEELHQYKDDQKDDQIISIVKETIFGDVITEGTQNESMTTKYDETLHTSHISQNDTEPINIIDENVEEVTAQYNINAEISEIKGFNIEFKASDKVIIEQSEDLVNESKITEETSSTTDEKETEIPIESSSFSVTTDEIKVVDMPPLEVNREEKIYEPEHESINEEYEENDNFEKEEVKENDNFEKEEVKEINEKIKTERSYDENLSEETLKEVLLNNTWAKDESHEDSVPNSWTESHESQTVVWPDDANLEWSDITATTTEVTSQSEQALENTHESEEVLSHEISSTVLVEETMTEQVESIVEETHEISSTVLVEETIIEQVEPIVEETLAQSTVESHIEHKEKESDETGIGITSEVKEPSFVQCEKPESSATADEISATSTTVVEEIVTSRAIDKLKSDDMSEKLDVNISRKIISISPSTSSPGESTRNADMYTHNITVATNVSRSIHKKPVEITINREELHDINSDCEEKIDLNEIAHLVTSVTSVATTFTLGVISVMYTSVFGK